MWALGICLLYPVYYDGILLFQQGWSYFSNYVNFIDLVHIINGYLNIALQMSFNGTWQIDSLICMILLVMTSLFKTMFFMKVFQNFSHIVTMITRVMIDLRIFLVFFFILLIMFSMVFNVVA